MKLWKKLLTAGTLLAAVWCPAAEQELPEPLAGFDFANAEWKLNQYSSIKTDGNRKILTVTVPQNETEGMHVVSLPLDLTKYADSTLCFTIEAKGDVSQPLRKWNGGKFMLNYLDGNGIERWSHPSDVYGKFDWKQLSLTITAEAKTSKAVLILGIQDSFGQIEFDLNTLKVFQMFAKQPSDYKIKYSDKVSAVGPLRGVMSPHQYTEEDFKTLADWHVNLIRCQITRDWGKANTDQNLDEYDAWLDKKLNDIEQASVWAKKYNIKMIIDLHSPPGGRDDARNMRMFSDTKYANHFVKVWEKIATRFKGNDAIWGYDLVNEPEQTRPAKYDYFTIQRMAAEAVRKIDPQSVIIIESNNWDSPETFSYLPALEMDNVIYQVHMYMPGQYTHQGVYNTFGEVGKEAGVAYPGQIGQTYWDKNALRQALKHVRAFQLKHNARIFVGEFSAAAWAPNAQQYLQDNIDIFEEYHWDWTYHAFREWSGWSLEHAGPDKDHLQPSPDNPRKRAVLKALEKNIKP